MMLTVTTQVDVEEIDIQEFDVDQRGNLTIKITFIPKFRDNVRLNTITCKNLIKQSPELRQLFSKMIINCIESIKVDSDSNATGLYMRAGVKGKKATLYLFANDSAFIDKDMPALIEEHLKHIA